MRPGGDSKNDAATRSVIEVEPTTRGAAHGRAAPTRGAWWSSAFEPALVGAGSELQHIAMVVVGLESVLEIVWCGWSAPRLRRTLPAIAPRGGAPRSRDQSAPPDAVSSSRAAGPCAFLPDSLPASGGYQMRFMLFALPVAAPPRSAHAFALASTGSVRRRVRPRAVEASRRRSARQPRRVRYTHERRTMRAAVAMHMLKAISKRMLVEVKQSSAFPA